MESVSSKPTAGNQARSQARAQALAAAVARVEPHLQTVEGPAGEPVLVVLSGVPGSGKSYLAQRLQPRLSATIVETDHVRRVLFHPPCYTGTENAWVYAVCHALIESLLGRGLPVIFDATNLLEHGRRHLYKIADRAQAKTVVVHTIAPDEIIRQRLRMRSEMSDPTNHSDATVDVYEKLRLTEQAIRRRHLVIDTTQDTSQSVERIVHELGDTSYRVLDHTADLAIEVWGNSLEDLFANAATAMFAQMADLARVSVAVRRTLSVEGDDSEALLVAWLSELLYLREVNREAYARFQVQLPAPGKLDGIAEGGPWHAFERPVKAVTYHALTIEHKAGRYHTTIVFDV